ncbi:pentatricopeptide repeat-containing protein At1g80270, mitochondrial-like [Ananas comosus]|uniref:Pentatricopeptide repeat-containing protein At1g80270, mitochondrial-like n=1 Tax=Ananas comosus TaxID=4615 RepID=A0A6P5ECB7_ANACO|nr:pentatricopeptide repeat-containing protein At1g80270, mitochondrial-like [Ananas comosus]
MWAIRRAAIPVRSHTHRFVVARCCHAIPETPSNYLEQREVRQGKEYGRSHSYYIPKSLLCGSSISPTFLWGRNLSSQACVTSNSKADDAEEGFSDLDVPPETDNSIDLSEEGNLSEEDSGEAADKSIGLSDSESDLKGKKVSSKKVCSTPLFKIIIDASRPAVTGALNKWVEEGNALGRNEVSFTLLTLRKRKKYAKALQFMEWLESTKRLDFAERDYASQLDLIAKVYGINKAEKFIEKIPQSCRGEIIYRTLLANCVGAVNVSKAEEVFNKMRDLGLPISTFACNQLLLLYKRINKKKIADVLLLMEKENVKPSLFTYKLLVDTKGISKDISGMEQIMETMKSDGIEPDFVIQAMVIKHYISAGLKDKAEAALKEMEGSDIKENRASCKALLPLYAALGKADEVERIWKECEASPRIDEFLAVIEAWGKLGLVEKAEEAFEEVLKKWKKLSSMYYTALLKVYANHKLLSKGKDLVKRMSDNGCRIGPTTLDVLVKLYVEAGEVEKADSILQRANQNNQIKPRYNTYITLLENYAKRGDIHNAEKVFNRLRQIAYAGRMKQYQLLLLAYVNAKTPAYGFRERMKADNIFPNKAVAAQLAAVDAFRKTQISELLD